MHKIKKILVASTKDIASEVSYFFAVNTRYIANMINILSPYMMYLLGQTLALKRNVFTVGGEIFMPLLLALFAYYLRQIANRIGKGNIIPTPEKRFTEVNHETGEVTIVTSRTEELLLYMADLEDYLERKNLL